MRQCGADVQHLLQCKGHKRQRAGPDVKKRPAVPRGTPKAKVFERHKFSSASSQGVGRCEDANYIKFISLDYVLTRVSLHLLLTYHGELSKHKAYRKSPYLESLQRSC